MATRAAKAGLAALAARAEDEGAPVGTVGREARVVSMVGVEWMVGVRAEQEGRKG